MMDMIVRIGQHLINIGEIVFIEQTGHDNYYKVINFLFKSGKEKEINFTDKEYENLMEYYKALCPDLMDNYTRNMMINHITMQRQQLVQQMINDGRLPKTDFPDQMKGPNLR